jgi:thiosulfate/3-mercaptopyruvate sulfurtransferase
VNHYYRSNAADDFTLLPAGDLREQFRKVLGSHEPSQAVVYCGSGVTACHNLLAMAHAGLPGARLYAGSWSEWSADPARPIAVGPAHSSHKGQART